MAQIIGDIIPPAIPELVQDVNDVFGNPPSDGETLIKYVTMLILAYGIKDTARDERKELLHWVYNSNMANGEGLESMDVSRKIPSFVGTSPADAASHIVDALERIAVPDEGIAGIPDMMEKIQSSMSAHMPWFNIQECNYLLGMCTMHAARICYFVGELMYGLVPNSARSPLNLCISSAAQIFGAGTPETKKCAQFLTQASMFDALAESHVGPGNFKCIVPKKEIIEKRISMFNAALGSASPHAAQSKDQIQNTYVPGNLDTVIAVAENMNPTQTQAELTAGTQGSTPSTAAGSILPGDNSVASANEGPESNVMPSGLDRRSYNILERMAVDDEQLLQALEKVMSGTFHLLPFLTTYQPGLTERAVSTLLDTYTDKASHRSLTKELDTTPRSTTAVIPPAFKEDRLPAIWTRAVITSLGYPFINFTCPSIMELLRGTDPKRMRDAYKNVKALFKQCKLKKPIETLKAFAGSEYRNCMLNALCVDANELYTAEAGTSVSASVINPYSKSLSIKGSTMVPMDFLTAFYKVLSPIQASAQYCEACGMSREDYMSYLENNGKPPMYILNPKKVAFRRGPKGSLFHELFSSKAKPVLVRARVSSHDGGFIIPERVVDLLFST